MKPSRTIRLSDRQPLTVDPRRPPAAFRPSAATEDVDQVDPVVEPARRLPDWCELCLASPSLLRFETEAGQAGENRFPGWLNWIRTYGDFRYAVHVAAESLGVSFSDAMRVVTARLTAAYDAAYRRAHRGRKQ